MLVDYTDINMNFLLNLLTGGENGQSRLRYYINAIILIPGGKERTQNTHTHTLTQKTAKLQLCPMHYQNIPSHIYTSHSKTNFFSEILKLLFRLKVVSGAIFPTHR